MGDPLELPLRDIHLPEPVSWWPPAPGWWSLLVLILTAGILALWWQRRRMQNQRSVKRLSLQHLTRLRTAFAEHKDCQRLTRELSALLRRASVSAYSREETAGLTGEAWLSFLDQSLGDRRFTHGAGRFLLDAPYQRQPRLDASDLLSLCEDWILKLPEKPAGERM